MNVSALRKNTPAQQQTPPGLTKDMNPLPDHGEESYKGSEKLKGKVALITGGDSGIGRAVAIAYAREGADVVISYLNEDDDAKDTANWVEKAGRKVLLIPGDIASEDHCKKLVADTVKTFGKIDIIVNNAAHQRTFSDLSELDSDTWRKTLDVNISAPFYICKAAAPHLKEGASIINTTSIQAKNPSGELLSYATSKGAVLNFTEGLAKMLAKKNIRVNAVAPGPIWTPLIPATMPEDEVEGFGKETPLGRPGQPAELAGAYVLLASDASSYMTGATIPVTGGSPMV